MSHFALSRRRLVIGSAMLGAFVRPTYSANMSESDDLWKATAASLLDQDLWIDRDLYDTAHHLMVPMHTAFHESSPSAWSDDLHGFFDRFTRAWKHGEYAFELSLNHNQFLWFTSQYLRLCHENDHAQEFLSELTSLASGAFETAFIGTPMWHWTQTDLSSLKESIEWKLSKPDVDFEYYRVVLDQEMFPLAVGADLLQISPTAETQKLAKEARDLGLRVLREQSEWTEDGEWQFQFGSFWDHRDYAYAIYDEPEADMTRSSIPGIAGDISHAHRTPLLLKSFDPGEQDPELSGEIVRMKQGLAKQFTSHALVMPSADIGFVRTTNYLDGHNGLYRWQYETQGDNNGYLPYQLSLTFLLGWWSFLNDSDFQAAYDVAVESFPLSEEAIEVYVGPNTTRERNPMFTLPASLQNGMIELTSRCAALMGSL